MVTVQNLVKEELDHNPILIDVLQQNIANINAVALKILPLIEKRIKRKIKLSAVSMGIRRYNTEITHKSSLDWRFPKNLEISTKSQIYEVAIENTPEISRILKEIHNRIKREKGDSSSVIEGSYETVIFTNQSKKEIVKEILKGQKITSEAENLAYITVNWEKITKDIPGIYYRITRSLAFRGIPIQSMRTIGAEMMIFFKEDVFLEAYQVMSNLLRNKVEL